jgi:zinc metalloprotease ZmpB
MDDQYDPDLKAQVSTDEDGTVRHILHTDERWLPSEEDPRRAAMEYVRSQAAPLRIQEATLDSMEEPVSHAAPRSEGESLRVVEEKRQFDSTTVAFAQTFLNVPVWGTGVSVTIKGGPSRIVDCTNTTLADVQAEMPPEEAVARWRELIAAMEGRPAADRGEQPAATPADETVRRALGLAQEPGERARTAAGPDAAGLRVNRGRFFVYRYDPSQRQPVLPGVDSVVDAEGVDPEDRVIEPTLPLPPVPETVRPGGDYLVVEVLFTLPFSGISELNWRALIEVETDAVLYLRALISGVSGLVFAPDPITSTGVLTNTADQPDAVLNPLRRKVTLRNLDGAVGGRQSLLGSNVAIVDNDVPTARPPTRPSGSDFDFDARTNDFAAVGAYHHADNVFSTIEDLGFKLDDYFDGTLFPVRVDHRASFQTPNGIEVNAFCGGDADGDGIGAVGFCLGDTTNVTKPLGRAVDSWVHWHEIGGHGVLFDHVGDGTFGFAHSAGDGLAGIQHDPESRLRGLPERFRYAPIRPGSGRWMNRSVADGWAWGGAKYGPFTPLDSQGYLAEQILATCHFRIYRSVGGDSDDLDRRRFASRVVTYLILRAIGDLTEATNPADPLMWCKRLMATDELDWISEGLAGGAYNKVIRWAFEQQGLFQAPGAPTPVTTVGAPPDVDVYIDDGRGGEYPYQPVHWENPSVWNRNAADDQPEHQPAVASATNFAYVKVKNRGTSAAANVTVKGFHSLPGPGLTWPTDFTAMIPADGLVVPSVPANSSGEVKVGPFEWVPDPDAFGHDCLLMIASVPGDTSNVELLTAGETMEDRRLVPNDNNIGQRNL